MHKLQLYRSILWGFAFSCLMVFLDSIGVSEEIELLVWFPFSTAVFVVNYFMEPEVKVKFAKWGIIYILILVLGVVLAMWFDKQTIYSALMLGYNDYQIPLFPLVIGVFALYLPVTWIFWRKVYLLGCWKLLFCLTIYPIFIVLMIINIWVTNWYAPWLFALLDATEGFVDALIVFFIFTSVSVGLSFVWYKLISWFNTGLRDDIGRHLVCRIPHDFQKRGNVSLIRLLREAGAWRNPETFDVEKLTQEFRRYPGLVDRWIEYSEDKRTVGGWSLGRENSKHYVVESLRRKERLQYADAAIACANYVVREMGSIAGIERFEKSSAA